MVSGPPGEGISSKTRSSSAFVLIELIVLSSGGCRVEFTAKPLFSKWHRDLGDPAPTIKFDAHHS